MAFFSLDKSRTYSTGQAGVLGCDRELQGLTGCLIDILCRATGVQASGSSTRSLPMTLREVLPWGVNKPWAQYSLISGANSNQISELIPFTVTALPAIRSSSLPFCLRFNVSLLAPGSYRHAAKLDTGRVASTYPGGISPRLSIRPCQSARACVGYPRFSGAARIKTRFLREFLNPKDATQAEASNIAAPVNRKNHINVDAEVALPFTSNPPTVIDTGMNCHSWLSRKQPGAPTSNPIEPKTNAA